LNLVADTDLAWLAFSSARQQGRPSVQSKSIFRCLLVASTLLAGGVAYADPAQPDQIPPTTPTTTPPTSDQPQTPESTPQPAASQDEQKVVCKKIDPPTGTRAGGRKVCKTVAEWRRDKDASKEVLDEVQSKSRTWNPPGG
jgi:hypothetical protein